MAKGWPHKRQVRWRSGWSTASERAGQAPTGQPGAVVTQLHRPAGTVGALGGHEGPVVRPGPHLTPTFTSAVTRPASSLGLGRSIAADAMCDEMVTAALRAASRAPEAAGRTFAASLRHWHTSPPARKLVTGPDATRLARYTRVPALFPAGAGVLFDGDPMSGTRRVEWRGNRSASTGCAAKERLRVCAYRQGGRMWLGPAVRIGATD